MQVPDTKRETKRSGETLMDCKVASLYTDYAMGVNINIKEFYYIGDT